MLSVEVTVVAFCGKTLVLGRWNLQMSWCKCLGAPRGQPPGMATNKCIIFAKSGTCSRFELFLSISEIL